jgi:hypothetical protein
MNVVGQLKVCFTGVVVWLSMIGAGAVFSQDLRSVGNCVDYVVVSSSANLPLASQLASFRSTNDGFTTLAVSIDTILAQFELGSSPDSALKAFIQYAIHSWQEPVPRYFVLAGNINTVPSHHEASFVSDDDSLWMDQWFVEGSSQDSSLGIARAMIGRLPAWDSTSLAVMIRKLIEYESLQPESWWSRCVGLADDDYGVFERDLQQLQRIAAGVWDDTVTVHIRSTSSLHLDSTEFRRLWDEGAAILTYCGHAMPYVFSASYYFTISSIDSLKNRDRLPVCLLGGCDQRMEPMNPSSIPVRLLEREDAGAITCIASEGKPYEGVVVALFDALLRHLATTPVQTVGESFRSAKNQTANWVSRRFMLLGDPALRIKRPQTIASIPMPQVMASSFALDQNYPNPFNPYTTIRFALKNASHVSLAVFDALGQKVAVLVDGTKEAGHHEVRFDGTHLASGVYFCQLQLGAFTLTKKMLLMR